MPYKHLSGDEIQSFSFLSETHVVLAILWHEEDDEGMIDSIEPTLLVLDFMEEIEGPRPQNVLELDTGVHFRYPLLDEQITLVDFEIRADPAPAWRPGYSANVPFHLARNQRLYVVSLWVHVNASVRCLVLFVPSKTLLNEVKKVAEDKKLGRQVLLWRDWGPTGTRMMLSHHPHSHIWVCYVYGMRYIALEAERNTGQKVWARVYDFNDAPLRRGLSEEDKANMKSGTGFMSKERSTETVWETGTSRVYGAKWIFREKVETSLPFRWRSVELPDTSEPSVSAMVTEDNIILVEVSRCVLGCHAEVDQLREGTEHYAQVQGSELLNSEIKGSCSRFTA